MRRQFVLAISLALMVGLSAASFARAWAWQENGATATLYNQAGDEVGTVRFTQADDLVQIWVEVADLPSGFHGFHVHTTGVCDAATAFMSAGGHLDLADMMGGTITGGHAGDMTNLYVNADGTGSMTTTLDRFAVSDLFTDGGRSVIVHAAPDNFRNIPDRYGVTLDQMTLDTGDAGPRLACGTIQAS